MGSNIHRKLASIQKIEEILDIDGADLIQAYRVLGWWVVDKKNAYNVGDFVIYVSIDSWVPHELAPFLSKNTPPREYNSVKGERLKTIRLKGQVSQGLLLPMETAFEWDADEQKWEYNDHPEMTSETGEVIEHEDRIEIPISFTRVFADEGDDLTEILGIQKWEAPIPAQLQGQAKGTFPTSLIPKTDQERCCDADTIVVTKDGEKTIKEICDGKYQGEVLSLNHETNSIEFKKVIGHSIMTRKNDQWVLIKTKSGKEIKVTKNHKVFLPKLGCYREAQNIKVGDNVNILS